MHAASEQRDRQLDQLDKRIGQQNEALQSASLGIRELLVRNA
jgi:hypothetical protein